MKEKSALNSLLEMKCDEARKLLTEKKKDENYLISPAELARFLAHCEHCEKCRKKAQEIDLIP